MKAIQPAPRGDGRVSGVFSAAVATGGSSATSRQVGADHGEHPAADGQPFDLALPRAGDVAELVDHAPDALVEGFVGVCARHRVRVGRLGLVQGRVVVQAVVVEPVAGRSVVGHRPAAARIARSSGWWSS